MENLKDTKMIQRIKISKIIIKIQLKLITIKNQKHSLAYQLLTRIF